VSLHPPKRRKVERVTILLEIMALAFEETKDQEI
jgi:hypothetical protein